jgi:hypothetical protein
VLIATRDGPRATAHAAHWVPVIFCLHMARSPGPCIRAPESVQLEPGRVTLYTALMTAWF